MIWTLRLPALAMSCILFGSGALVAARAPESYSARVVNLDEPRGRSPGLMQVRVRRWASDAERDDLTSALLTGGQDGLLTALKKLPEAGVIRTPGTAGYPFKYARRLAHPTGGETILVVVDRPIGFAEFRQGWQTVDYPFTVVELTLNDGGVGTGRLLPATRLEANPATGDIAFDQYHASPMLLQSVRQE